ncbi:MAG: alkaline phosphatase D family protein [Verrucomicrobia bacterium]|nr:alkaline phosphatase D family protein [Verrucomicrobiota bacterium]
MNSSLDRIENGRGLNRRSFLAAAASSWAAAVCGSSSAFGAVRRHPKFSNYPFQLGVASGDPDATSVVLWTRLAPQPLDGGGMTDEPVEVSWQIAEDEGMTRVVRKGAVVARTQWAHSVHVEVGGLRPERWYWYQFKAGGEVSPKGRTRTMPPANSSPDQLRFAFASCQHFETGFFTAYEHMLREDLELVVHLGDYIYEGAGRDKQIRKHLGAELSSLDDYRNRYAQYRTDAALQAMHAAAPWIVTWDDHEFDNNCAGAISEEKGVTSAAFLKRRAAAYRAYYEHMPLRRATLPKGPNMKLYRRLPYGRLAEFFVLDTRQYRTDQPCGDGNKPPCEAVYDPRGTLLGRRQRNWLERGLAGSPAQWNVLAQQVMMAHVDRTVGEAVAYSMDQWPGYEMERRRILRFLHERKISNPVVLTGDIHSNWANELIVDFDRLDSRSVATEFVGSSISSGGDGTRAPKDLDKLLAENPFVKFHNAERGYVRCQVSRKEWRADYQMVEYVTRTGAPLVTRASFVVEAGQPRLNKA